MVEMRKTVVEYLVCVTCWCLSGPLLALTVSDIELKSRLNQTLDARIDLNGITNEELNSLVVGVTDAGQQGFVRALNLKYELKNDDARHYIQLTTNDVVREPVLMFTLELRWANGHLLRDYTLLLDPK